MTVFVSLMTEMCKLNAVFKHHKKASKVYCNDSSRRPCV